MDWNEVREIFRKQNGSCKITEDLARQLLKDVELYRVYKLKLGNFQIDINTDGYFIVLKEKINGTTRRI
jgi:hypothetical protein